MTEITLDSVVTRSAEIVSGIVDTDMMMMSIESGKYYHLNISAGRIWDMLESPRKVSEICKILSKEFKVTSDTCQKDVIHFLDELTVRKVVTVE